MAMIDVLPGLGEAATVARYGDEIVEFGERGLLRTGLLKAGRMAWNEQAHHLIPLQLRLRPVVQAAARVGFDMNAPLNGIGLPRWRVLQIPLEEDLDAAGRLVVTLHARDRRRDPRQPPRRELFRVLKRLEEIAASIGPTGSIDPMLARSRSRSCSSASCVPRWRRSSRATWSSTTTSGRSCAPGDGTPSSRPTSRIP